MHKLFLIYFVNLYMFWAYLGPSSGGTVQPMYTTTGTVCCAGWIGTNPTRTTDSHLKRIISTNCCIHTVVPPDDGLDMP